MRSKITIDLDERNRPIIKIDYYQSDDVRDKMVKRFLETFGDGSWANFRFLNDQPSGTYINSIAEIAPISGYEIPEHFLAMSERARIHYLNRLAAERASWDFDSTKMWADFLEGKTGQVSRVDKTSLVESSTIELRLQECISKVEGIYYSFIVDHDLVDDVTMIYDGDHIYFQYNNSHCRSISLVRREIVNLDTLQLAKLIIDAIKTLPIEQEQVVATIPNKTGKTKMYKGVKMS